MTICLHAGLMCRRLVAILFKDVTWDFQVQILCNRHNYLPSPFREKEGSNGF
jgi:hypothetical protein